ncbi:hypothetical protein [Kordiimonas marina]|uniref:hypothetical protein n=1 Tax=Kordiimonas marina TaxID=2872312 RepID=UPI001FF67EE0|nr:hypothetical protein [Kordiimonas marina]MCJ9430347.1 hypothetical protein [Kordiimonas marina]
MYIEDQQTKRLFGSDPTMGLFVALYLILLAFFIVLAAMSEQAEVRSSAALESVNSTFQKGGHQKMPEINPAAKDAAQDTVLSGIQREFMSEMNIKGRFSRAGGNVFEVQFPQEYLFQKGSFQVRSDMGPFLDQLIRILREAPAGNRQEVVFLFGSGNGAVRREITRSQEVAIRRAGSLARYLRDQGLPSGTFSAGFTAIPRSDIVAVFRNTLRRDEILDLGRDAVTLDGPVSDATQETSGE